jgi:hypothetical protein
VGNPIKLCLLYLYMYTSISEDVQESSPKLTKMAYLKKIMLHFKLFTIVADQVVDTILVVSLFLMQEVTCNL